MAERCSVVCGHSSHLIRYQACLAPNFWTVSVKRNRRTLGCLKTIVFFLCILSAFSLAGTNSHISEFGTAIPSPDTCGKCSSTRERYRDRISRGTGSKLSCEAISMETGTTRRRSTRCLHWNSCTAFSWTRDKPVAICQKPLVLEK